MEDVEIALRAAALMHVQELRRRHGDVLDWAVIDRGFVFQGQHFHLASRARGIFRPAQMTGAALSIKTTVVREGRLARYDDQLRPGSDVFEYRYQGTDPNGFDNAVLREAMTRRLPVIYFHGLAPGRYAVISPAFVVGDHPERLTFEVAAELPAVLTAPAYVSEGLFVRERPPLERRYATVAAKVRLHQARFREMVLDAYQQRCAVCVLRERELLEAAHIVPDRDEQGVAEIPNGLALCELHHAAFDRNLLGIRPDLVIMLNQRLVDSEDGPMLEHGLKAFHLKKLRHVPRSETDRPATAYLEERWRQFSQESQPGRA